MTERNDIISELTEQQVLLAVRWAYESAVGRTLDDHSEAAGYNANSAGTNRHTLFCDRLDRVFSCGRYEVAEGAEDVGLDILHAELTESDVRSMPPIAPGTVRRANIKGSPGWSNGRIRVVLASVPSGSVVHVDWMQMSKTKQSVAMQPAGTDAEPTLFDALGDELLRDLEAQSRTRELDMDTFVVAHLLNTDTGERQLVLGRAHDNRFGGDSWVWWHDLLSGPMPEGGRISPSANGPVPTQEVADADVRLRRPAAAKDVK